MSDSFVPRDLTEWTTQARRDDWHMRFVGSDIRCMLAEIERLREVHRWCPLDDHARALGPIMLGWAGTGFEPDKGFWDSTTQAWGYLTNEMAFEPFHRPPTHWQPLPAPPQI